MMTLALVCPKPHLYEYSEYHRALVPFCTVLSIMYTLALFVLERIKMFSCCSCQPQGGFFFFLFKADKVLIRDKESLGCI